MLLFPRIIHYRIKELHKINKQYFFKLSSVLKQNAKNINTCCKLQTQIKITKERKEYIYIYIYIYIYKKKREKYKEKKEKKK